MTFDERVQAVQQKGFTERQARFLTTVMLHAGVCVPRQYARFCGIVYGAKTRKFFDKLVQLRYASMYDCRHNRARVYHVNQRALYAAIGEAESRLRKPVTLNHAIQRLMVLDAIVEDPDLVWLGTAEEKSIHLTTLLRIDPADLPHVSIGEGDARTVRYFPDRLPIGIHPAGCGVVVYVVTDPWLDDFRLFLLRHAALLRALPAWTLRVVVPPHFPDIGQRAKQVVWNQLMTPLKTDIPDELRWYFEQARAHPAPSRSRDLDERFYRWIRETWNPRAARNGQPHLTRQLCPDIVESQSGQQAYHSGRHRPTGQSERMILTDVSAHLAIASRADAFEFTSANHPSECAGVNALRSGITGSEDRAFGHEAQHVRASGSSRLRHCGFDTN